jgi:hypothetical protein
MTITLADLILQLQEDVPPVSGVPSDAQYERAIKDAVSEFSRRCGVVKNGTLAVVAGTAAYALPADFMSIVDIDSPYEVEGDVIITATGIIPFSALAPFEEDFTVQNGTITFFPVPTYTMTRYYEYKAAWVLETNSYALTDDEVRIIMLKAKQLCFDKLANSSKSFKYTVGNMTVDKSGNIDNYSKRQFELHGQFVTACDEYNGAVIR